MPPKGGMGPGGRRPGAGTPRSAGHPQKRTVGGGKTLPSGNNRKTFTNTFSKTTDAPSGSTFTPPRNTCAGRVRSNFNSSLSGASSGYYGNNNYGAPSTPPPPPSESSSLFGGRSSRRGSSSGLKQVASSTLGSTIGSTIGSAITYAAGTAITNAINRKAAEKNAIAEAQTKAKYDAAYDAAYQEAYEDPNATDEYGLTKAEREEYPLTCPHCLGIPDGSRYCPYCGSRLV